MEAVDTIWAFIEKSIRERHPDLSDDIINEYLNIIRSDANFITGLQPIPQKFSISVKGQAIGFELYYDPLLLCWKCNLLDALGGYILTNITLMAGMNLIRGMHLRYRARNYRNEIVDEPLVITGLYTTEPLKTIVVSGLYTTEPSNKKFDKYERGIESSKYAFSPDDVGICACAILYFTSAYASDLYARLINGEKRYSLARLEDLDFEIKVL